MEEPFHLKACWKYTAVENGELSMMSNLTLLTVQQFAYRWAIITSVFWKVKVALLAITMATLRMSTSTAVSATLSFNVGTALNK